MDELIGRLVAKVGVDRTAPDKVVGTSMQLSVMGDVKAQALLDQPLVVDPTRAAQSNSTPGALAGAMGAALCIARETLGFAREKAGKDAVEEIAIPGLG